MNRQYALRIITIAFVVFVGGFFIFGKSNYALLNNSGNLAIVIRQAKLDPPPSPVRGIYVTSWVAGSSRRTNELIKLIDETELNAVVIDVKDYSGQLAFRTSTPLAEKSGAHKEIRIRDIDGLINRLHEKNIYVIGRVQVFQDPTLAEARPDLAVQDGLDGGVWRDHKGLAWLDPAAQEVWDYTVAIAQEMDKHGFDEVNLDYIRFPSDGLLSRMRFFHWDGILPRHEVIRSFYSYFREKTKEAGIRISADVFGMTALNALNSRYDGNIGQRMVDALSYFDFVSPMVYPSHYATGTIGLADSNADPYRIVNTSLLATQALTATTTGAAQIRPWLQDFDLGKDYTAADVRAQIQAVYDAGLNEWLLWNASNRYTKEALMTQ